MEKYVMQYTGEKAKSTVSKAQQTQSPMYNSSLLYKFLCTLSMSIKDNNNKIIKI